MTHRTFISVQCDTCTKYLVQGGQRHFSNKTQADQAARERGWTVGTGGGHWCGCPERKRR